jgi:Domain of unknown function (DUF4157)
MEEGSRKPRPSTAQAILGLQATAGNQAVARLLWDPAADEVRRSVEHSLGTDLSSVSLHTDSAAADAIGARAFARGDDIHIAPGEPGAESREGRELLGHELAHVVQQRHGRVAATAEVAGVAVNRAPRLEAEATRIGQAAATTSPAPVVRAGPAPAAATAGGGGVAQLEVNKEQLKLKLKSCKSLPEMGAYLTTKVRVKVARGDWGTARPKSLAAIGLATVEYIRDNPLEDGVVYTVPDDYDRKDVIAEAEAIMETLESRARYSEGGGLLHSTAEKQWAYQKPAYSPTTEKRIHDERAKLPYWSSPASEYRPDPGDATPMEIETPKGTELKLVTSYDFHTPKGTEHSTKTYASGIEKREPLLSATGPTSALTKIKRVLHTHKRAGAIKVDEKKLNKWSSQRAGWSPDQNGAMGGVSATEAARASGFASGEWQWLHLHAFTFGGHDGVQPNHPDNLVSGLAAANGKHLVLENLVKRLILSKETDEVEINATAKMIINSYQVAEKIDYLLRWTAGTQYRDYEFSIECADPNKAMGGHLSLLFAEFKS